MPQGAQPCTGAHRGYGLVPSLTPQASTEDTGDVPPPPRPTRGLLLGPAQALAGPWKEAQAPGALRTGVLPTRPAAGTRLEPGAGSLQPRGGPRVSTWGCLMGTVP